MAKPKAPVVTAAEYLRMDRQAPIKGEYYGGTIFPNYVDGFVSPIIRDDRRYLDVIGRVRGALDACLDQRKYYLFQEHMRIWTPNTNSYLYPEFAIGANEPICTDGNRDTLQNPLVVLDISRNLNAGLYFDRTRFPHIRWIPTLRDYIYVNQGFKRLIHYTKRDDLWWLKRTYRYSRDIVELPSIECSFNIDVIFDELRPWPDLP
jgi:hypothetical protein